MSNRLALETSPYLQQHKDNPIHWFPYGDEAFEEAKNQNKPVFISIGYSSCHWCHVMARESFTDPDTASYMNEHFINIKIDREEHPGIDKAYQEMYTLVNKRGGGWPLSVFALPDGAPFVLATYIPKENKYQMKSFMQVNKDVVDAWENNRDQVIQQATAIMEGLNQYIDYVSKNEEGLVLSDDLFTSQIMALQKRFDRTFGGFGPAPKFPRVSTLRFLLQEGMIRGEKKIVDFVRFSFHKMANGGIYDQLGGGFSRYSVDQKWLVPHFEKMLYDNAALMQLGSELYAAVGDSFSKWIVFDTLTWLAREMRSKFGGFYSSLNAESEGREGKFFVWTNDEMKSVLGDNFKIAKLRFGITKHGNFKDPHHPEIKGMNVLSVVKSIPELSQDLGIDEDDIVKQLNIVRQKLFEERGKRISPSRDTKIITSWNAMMITALYSVAEKLELEDAANLANEALEFLIKTMAKEDRLIHSFHEIEGDQQYKMIEGVLDDYSLFISALIKAFEFTDKWEYLELARKYEKLATKYFYDEKDKAYFVNRNTSGGLFNKVIQVGDESMMSGFAVMVDNLFKLGKYLEKPKLIERGRIICDQFSGSFNDYPGSMNGFMMAASNYLRYPLELVLVDTNESELDCMHEKYYIPNRLVYRWHENNKNDGRIEWEVLESRITVEKPTVFKCEGMTCSLPLVNKKSMKSMLESIYIEKNQNPE